MTNFAWHLRHFHPGAHHRLWVILAAVLAFLMVALWPRSIG
jgi:hypothetical protein